MRRRCSTGLREGSSLQNSWKLSGAQGDAQYSLSGAHRRLHRFYTSIHHATAVGRMMRPDNPVAELSLDSIGYHGRSSSRVSGQTFRRLGDSGFRRAAATRRRRVRV